MVANYEEYTTVLWPAHQLYTIAPCVGTVSSIWCRYHFPFITSGVGSISQYQCSSQHAKRGVCQKCQTVSSNAMLNYLFSSRASIAQRCLDSIVTWLASSLFNDSLSHRRKHFCQSSEESTIWSHSIAFSLLGHHLWLQRARGQILLDRNVTILTQLGTRHEPNRCVELIVFITVHSNYPYSERATMKLF